MKQWTVNYRGEGGKQTSLVIEAEDRNGVFAELKKRGITAVGVREGATKQSSGASPMRGLFAGVIVVVIAAVAMYFVFKDNAKPEAPKEPKKARAITELPTPAPRPKLAPVAKREAKPEKPKEIPYWERPTTNGLNEMQIRKWKHAHRPPPGYTNTTSLTEAPPAYAIFQHPCENTIAGYLTMTPGETLVGTPHYGPKFTQQFLKSLENPIIVTKDDTPEQAELKRLMIETKIDLKARYDQGEDIGKILEDTHAEYQRLATIKFDIQQELNEFRKNPDATLEDVELFLQAANKLLEEKGVAPLELSPIAKRMLLRRNGDQR